MLTIQTRSKITRITFKWPPLEIFFFLSHLFFSQFSFRTYIYKELFFICFGLFLSGLRELRQSRTRLNRPDRATYIVVSGDRITDNGDGWSPSLALHASPSTGKLPRSEASLFYLYLLSYCCTNIESKPGKYLISLKKLYQRRYILLYRTFLKLVNIGFDSILAQHFNVILL